MKSFRFIRSWQSLLGWTLGGVLVLGATFAVWKLTQDTALDEDDASPSTEQKKAWLDDSMWREAYEAEDVDTLQSAAQTGDPLAQFFFGMLHWGAGSVPRSVPTAEKWLQKAFDALLPIAEAGDPVAQRYIGIFYDEGYGVVDRIDSEAMHWFRRAAEQGDAEAAYGLGHMYSLKQIQADRAWYSTDDEEERAKITADKKKYREEETRWYLQAAKQGSPSAQDEISHMYRRGDGVEVSCTDALWWGFKATTNPKNKVRYLHHEGRYIHHARKIYDAQRNLAAMYAENVGMARSDAEAKRYYHKFQKQLQGGESAFVIGILYLNEALMSDANDVDVKEEAMKWFREVAQRSRGAAEQGDTTAQSRLGTMYKYGFGVESSAEESEQWYRKALQGFRTKAEQGDAEAQIALGQMYEFGNGVESSAEEAKKWYLKAAEQGNPYAQFALGQFYAGDAEEDELPKDAYRWYSEAARGYREAADRGDCDAQHRLGVMYERGWGVQKSEKEAMRWYLKAAE